MRSLLVGLAVLLAGALCAPASADDGASGHVGATAAGLVGAVVPLRPARAAELVRVQAWAHAAARRVDVPERALEAYGAAEVRITRERPGCRLGWNTLAGVGYVESLHGTVGGRRLLPDGTSDRPVVGPTLGGDGYAAVRPTARTRSIHGDPQWDHAVGPMQFIGSSWQRWGADGDRDGRRDPLDLDDAALATARYLCASGRPLSRASWTSAVLSYNHDVFYVSHVFDAALAYAREMPVSASFFRG